MFREMEAECQKKMEMRCKYYADKIKKCCIEWQYIKCLDISFTSGLFYPYYFIDFIVNIF